MQEAFLHYIWRHQYFDKVALVTTENQAVDVIEVGEYNLNAGPDFSNAKIIIDGLHWQGDIEIHLNSADWWAHKHNQNPAYGSVVLHVVWADNKPVTRPNGELIPTIIIQNRVDAGILARHDKLLIDSALAVPCQDQLDSVSVFTKITVIERAMLQRLERKANLLLRNYWDTSQNWPETTWRMLCSAFGFKLNAAPMAAIAEVLPLKVLQKYNLSAQHLEAILLGQAGFIDPGINQYPEDPYKANLALLYHQFCLAMPIANRRVDKVAFKLSRLRPANHPVLRLVQLAHVLHHNPQLFNLFGNVTDAKSVISRLQLPLPKYWTEKYLPSGSHKDGASMGADSANVILLNVVPTLLFGFGMQQNREDYKERAIAWLEASSPENNRIIRFWASVGISAQHAADTQALIEQYNENCQNRKCLDCAIGQNLLRGSVR